MSNLVNASIVKDQHSETVVVQCIDFFILFTCGALCKASAGPKTTHRLAKMRTADANVSQGYVRLAAHSDVRGAEALVLWPEIATIGDLDDGGWPCAGKENQGEHVRRGQKWGQNPASARRRLRLTGRCLRRRGLRDGPAAQGTKEMIICCLGQF